MSTDPPPSQTTDDARRRKDLVLRLFVEGMPISKIAAHLARYEIRNVPRETPYQDIAQATDERLLHYAPPRGNALIDKLYERFSTSGRKFRQIFVPSYGGRMATISAAAAACAEAIWSIAMTKVAGRATGYTDRRTERHVAPWNFPVTFPHPDRDHAPTTAPYAEAKELIDRDADNKDKDKDKDKDKLHKKDVEPEPIEIVIRIGFCGGDTMARACRDLGVALAQGVEATEKRLKEHVLSQINEAKKAGKLDTVVPEGIIQRRFKVRLKFVFINLVSGFDRIPSTNPIAFLAALLNEPIPSERSTVDIFNAMPFSQVHDPTGFPAFEDIPNLRDLRAEALTSGFDTILTSGSCIDDPHNMFNQYFGSTDEMKKKAVQRLIDRLITEGVAGDFLWMPLKNKTPFDLLELWKRVRDEGDRELADLLSYQPMTLLTMEEIAKHVKAKRDVFFLLAPCGVCNVEKSRIARAAMEQDEQIVTHLFTDIDTAECLLDQDTA